MRYCKSRFENVPCNDVNIRSAMPLYQTVLRSRELNISNVDMASDTFDVLETRVFYHRMGDMSR